MKPSRPLTSLIASAAMAFGQGRPIDWPSYGGDAQRTGWEKSDSRITKENVKDFVLVLKRKLDNPQTGPYGLTPPVVIGNLISYRGFKELAFVAGSSGAIWSIDADLDRMFWQRKLEPAPKGACADRVAIPALTPPLNFAAGRAPRPAAAPASAPGRVGGTAFGAPRPVFVLASDGKLHLLNSSNGADQSPPLDFLPPSASASSLTLQDGVLYTTTSGCGGPSGVWAIDLNQTEPKPVSYLTKDGGVSGFALGADGTVYVQTHSRASGALLVLTPKELKLKGKFTSESMGSPRPVVFSWKDREMLVTAGRNGSLVLLDTQSLNADNASSAVYETAPLSSGGAWGGLSSWQDADGTRWVLAPVWGPLNSNLKALLANGDATHGSIVAFRLEEQQGKPVLTPAWVSRDLSSPVPPVITGGVVFALAAGGYSPDEQPTGAGHATLYALDGTTGKEMYSTGEQVAAPATLAGLTVSNGRVYFTALDSTLYAFGVFLER